MAAAGLRDWFRFVGRELEPHFDGDARAVMAELVAETWRRRYEDARKTWHWLPLAEERAVSRWAAGLYRVHPRSRGMWLWDGVGGPPTRAGDWLAALRAVAPATADERWRELTVHLGEWLIVLTEELPARLPRANAVLGDICFRAGVRYADAVCRLMAIERGGIRPDEAIEVLRMGEYLFRVNPEHQSGVEGEGGYIVGDACPWHPRPGWGRMHCGIFGQFQSGIASVFGLRYNLTHTIPKHGGDICRIDLKPVPLRVHR